MPLPLASALPILAIVLAMVLCPVLDAEIRRANARKAAALKALADRYSSQESSRCP